jgi:cold shock CspA family protein
MTTTETGIIKLFAPSRGYGMIAPHRGGPDVFFHADVCHIARSTRIAAGEPVRYQREACPGPHGWRATHVWLVRLPDVCPCCGGGVEAA